MSSKNWSESKSFDPETSSQECDELWSSSSSSPKNSLVKEGKCKGCGNKCNERVYCEECRDKRKKDLHAQGKCIHCGKNPSTEGHSLCNECFKDVKHSRNNSKNNEKKSANICPICNVGHLQRDKEGNFRSCCYECYLKIHSEQQKKENKTNSKSIPCPECMSKGRVPINVLEVDHAHHCMFLICKTCWRENHI